MNLIIIKFVSPNSLERKAHHLKIKDKSKVTLEKITIFARALHFFWLLAYAIKENNAKWPELKITQALPSSSLIYYLKQSKFLTLSKQCRLKTFSFRE